MRKRVQRPAGAGMVPPSASERETESVCLILSFARSFGCELAMVQETTEAETDGDGYLADGYSADAKSQQNVLAKDRQGTLTNKSDVTYENLQVLTPTYGTSKF